jgi:hypothetical protein
MVMHTRVFAIFFAIRPVLLAAAPGTAGTRLAAESAPGSRSGMTGSGRTRVMNNHWNHDVVNFALFAFFVVEMLFASSAFAQNWIEYRDTVDRFGVDMPKQPTVQDITYTSWRGRTMPGRIHAVEDGASRYSVSVINYASDPDVTDVLGSVAFAATNFRRRGGEVTFDAYQQVDRIPGHELHIRNADGSITYVEINLFERRLYILEATVPRNAAPPLEFQMSLSILDATGNRVRFELDACGNRISRVPNP